MTYPKLNPQFFAAVEVDRFWCQQVVLQFEGVFHNRLVPLYEWDGILYLGAPLDWEPQSSQFRIEGNWQIVLADPTHLALFWTQYFENISKTEPPATSSSSEVLAPAPLPTTELLEIAPEGISLSASLSTLTPPSDDPFESLKLTLEPPSASLSPQTPGMQLNSEDFSKQEVVPEGLYLDVDQELGSNEFPDLPNEVTELDRPIETSPKPIVNKSADSGSTPSESTRKLEINDSLSAPYAGYVELVLEGDGLKILAKPNGLKDFAIDLSTPSPFRVAYRTRHDFHGYVTQNSPTDTFFNKALGISSPKYLTIIPVLGTERVEKLIAAWSNENIQPLPFLTQIKTELGLEISHKSPSLSSITGKAS